MKLLFQKLPSTLLGIYDIDRDGNLNEMPERALYAHPDLANAILRMERDGVRLRYSDIRRSLFSSLRRRKELAKRGGPQLAARPSKSAHNFGLAIDIDVDWCLLHFGLKFKKDLDTVLRQYGLFCHRKDGLNGNEGWHYNCLGSENSSGEEWLLHSAGYSSTARSIDAKINAAFDFTLSKSEVESALKKTPHWNGEGSAIDYLSSANGNMKKAILDFQSDWGLERDGIAGTDTQRLLSLLLAEVVIS